MTRKKKTKTKTKTKSPVSAPKKAARTVNVAEVRLADLTPALARQLAPTPKTVAPTLEAIVLEARRG